MKTSKHLRVKFEGKEWSSDTKQCFDPWYVFIKRFLAARQNFNINNSERHKNANNIEYETRAKHIIGEATKKPCSSQKSKCRWRHYFFQYFLEKYHSFAIFRSLCWRRLGYPYCVAINFTKVFFLIILFTRMDKIGNKQNLIFFY